MISRYSANPRHPDHTYGFDYTMSSPVKKKDPSGNHMQHIKTKEKDT